MQAYHIETEVQQNGTPTVQNLPLHAGEAVEVIILVRPPTNQTSRYPLRNLLVHYDQPTEPVVEQDWEAI